jgi:hypothetical protein
MRCLADGWWVVFGRLLVDELESAIACPLPFELDDTFWRNVACQLAGCGTQYNGKSSGGRTSTNSATVRQCNWPVRDLIANLDGCSGAQVAEIAVVAGLLPRCHHGRMLRGLWRRRVLHQPHACGAGAVTHKPIGLQHRFAQASKENITTHTDAIADDEREGAPALSSVRYYVGQAPWRTIFW